MKRLYTVFFLLISCFAHCCAFSQDLIYYQSPQDDATRYKEWMDATDKRYKQDVAGLSGKNKKYLEQLYTQRYTGIKKLYDQKEIVSTAEATAYLQQLLNEIAKSNAAIRPLEPRVVFYRAWWPNASSMGEGTILFNIGLFNKLKNESQAAFVLCHELAHLYLNHSNNAINHYVETYYSDEFQQQLKKISKAEYQQNQQLDNLAKSVAFNSRRHSREHEAEADSMALEWMKNTSFDVHDAISCLNLLDSVDIDKYNVNPPLKQVLNFKDYPFQDKWVAEEHSLFNTLAASSEAENKKELDSLKTHPDCSIRVARLNNKVQQYYNSNSRHFVINETLFKKLQSNFDYEIIDYCYRSDNVSRSLYYTLQMQVFQPNNPYLVTNTGRCFNKLFTAQKNHTLSKVVDLPSPYNDKNYNTLLQFIQRVRLGDLAAFSYYYLQPNQPALQTNEEFLATLIESKDNFDKPNEKQSLIELYRKEFPTGKYHF